MGENRDNETLLQNARAGYQAAINLQSAEVQQTWNRSTVMTLANTILLNMIFFISDKKIYYYIIF